jgi:hypothetical protein
MQIIQLNIFKGISILEFEQISIIQDQTLKQVMFVIFPSMESWMNPESLQMFPF